MNIEKANIENGKVRTEIPLLEEIFADWQPVISEEYQGYRNHVYRMSQFVIALLEQSTKRNATEDEKSKIFIAAAFHDIGIWIEDTVDYIEPSIPPAIEYLKKIGKEDWIEEVSLMISEHHKMTSYKNKQFPLVEFFRQGDLVDFSFGSVKFGLDKRYVRTLREAIPNANFHKNLGKRAWKWFLKHPFNPAPMMKW